MATLHENTECYAAKMLNDIQKELNLCQIEHKLVLGKFNILYININSLQNKLDELEIKLQNFSKNNKDKLIHIIALTEVRIHDDATQFFSIPHYNSFYQTRADGHGGCALFVHESISCSLVEKKSTQNIEILTVSIIELGVSVTVVYKQPAVTVAVFVDIFMKYLENKKNLIIIGDFNINLLKDLNTTKRFIDALVANGLFVLNRINESAATRITFNSKSNHRNSNNYRPLHNRLHPIRFQTVPMRNTTIGSQ